MPVCVERAFMPTRLQLPHNPKRVGDKCPPYPLPKSLFFPQPKGSLKTISPRFQAAF